MKYVYVYLDPRKYGQWVYKDLNFPFEPFYIGVGQNNRINMHLTPYMLKQKTHKSSRIKSILNDGYNPIIYKIYENINAETAFAIEINFISHFGRLDIDTGILCNHTDGGIGWNKSKSLKKRNYKSYYRYNLEGKYTGCFTFQELRNQGLFPANISGAIKRSGTYMNYIWYYDYLGEFVIPTIKYCQRIGFSKEDRFQIRKLYLNGNTVDYISKSLNTSKEKIRKELKRQNIYMKEKISNRIVQLSLDNDIIRIWDKAFDIEKELNYYSSTILACCKKERKTYKKYKWKFYE